MNKACFSDALRDAQVGRLTMTIMFARVRAGADRIGAVAVSSQRT